MSPEEQDRLAVLRQISDDLWKKDRALEDALRDKRMMSETLAHCVDRCTKQETVIRSFRRLSKAVLDQGCDERAETELEDLIKATEGGRLP